MNFEQMQQKNTGKTHFYNDPNINLIPANDWEKGKEVYFDLVTKLAAALNIEASELELSHPNDPAHGDYSTNLALKQAFNRKQNPRELAADYVALLTEDPGLKNIVQKFEVAGAGFINIHLKKSVLIKGLLKVLAQETPGSSTALDGKRIMFEYAHPNPFKSLHIGHLRNVILGESLIRLLESQGAELIRVNYQGDVGMHIAKTLWAFQKVNPDSYPQDLDARVKMVAKCYAEGAAAFKDDESAKKEITAINKRIYSREDPDINKLYDLGKQWSLDKFHKIYDRLYSTFVREYMESETLNNSGKLIAEALEKGILERSEGAVVFKGEKYGLDTRVFLNSEGLPTYEGKELGLAHMQVRDYGDVDLIIHNVAVEQISFFKVTFKVEELLDPPKFKGKQYHNIYEFVGLKSGKMSSRTGNVVLAEDILDEAENRISRIVSDRENLSDTEKDEIARSVGIGAVKYSFLNISPLTYLAFDLEASLNFEGNSGPYLQYTYARANRILGDAGDLSSAEISLIDQQLQDPSELDLLRYFYRFEEVVIDSAKTLSPNLLTAYLFELTQKFNTFYKQQPILKEQNKEKRLARLLLTKASAKIISRGLYLLGIKVPEQM